MRTTELVPVRHYWHTLARTVADVASSYHMASESAYSESLGSAFLVPVTLPLVQALAANDNVDSLTLVEHMLRHMPVYVIARCYDNGQCELWLYDTLADAMVDWNHTSLELNGGYDVTFQYTVPSSEYTASYEYNSRLSYGTLTSSLGNTIVLLGDDASNLDDKLELLPTDDLVLLELSAYDVLWGDNG